MPRKSRQVRTKESVELVQAYEIAGMSNDYRFRFISDMIMRLERGRGLSAKQRTWLDSLIDEGVPAPKGDAELIKRIQEAMDTPGMEHCAQPLSDFMSRERKGYELSPKQRSFLDKMLKEGDHVRKYGPWLPSEKQEAELRTCLDLAKGRADTYWSSHPGEGRALMSVTSYINREQPTIDKWSVERLIKSFKAKFRELQKPYAIQGSMIWARIRGPASGMGMLGAGWIIVPALIAGEPEVDERGNIVYPALVDGNMVYMTQSQLSKRKPKMKVG